MRLRGAQGRYWTTADILIDLIVLFTNSAAVAKTAAAPIERIKREFSAYLGGDDDDEHVC